VRVGDAGAVVGAAGQRGRGGHGRVGGAERGDADPVRVGGPVDGGLHVDQVAGPVDFGAVVADDDDVVAGARAGGDLDGEPGVGPVAGVGGVDADRRAASGVVEGVRRDDGGGADDAGDERDGCRAR
jgi:hypothetical protein